jgi:hypothetical protein
MDSEPYLIIGAGRYTPAAKPLYRYRPGMDPSKDLSLGKFKLYLDLATSAVYFSQPTSGAYPRRVGVRWEGQHAILLGTSYERAYCRTTGIRRTNAFDALQADGLVPET